MRIGWTKRGLATAGALALAIGLTACAESERDSGDGSGGDGGSTFIFAGASDPVMLDPALASDGETFRVSRQIFEGLVTTEGDSTELAPALATEWESSEDGLTHSFTLREGVKFHDGTEFNAEAVCANFDRWHNWTGLNQNENISYYYNKMFRGFANPEEGKEKGIYESCTADSPTEATIQLNQPFASFVAAMTLPAFSMQSPTALEQYDADNTTGTVDDTRFSPYATEHPTGTGPFTSSRGARPAGDLEGQPRLLGRAGQERDRDHPQHLRPERTSAGAAGRQHRRLRPGRPR